MVIGALALGGILLLGGFFALLFTPGSPVKELIKRFAASAAAALYVVSPIDLIPDMIPVLGQADDVAVLLLLAYYWLSYGKRPSGPEHVRHDVPVSRQVIDVKPAD